MFYEGATEVHTVSGYVLEENTATGKLEWHKIEANLAHPDLSNTTDVHRVTCGKQIFGVAHPAPSGHHTCAGCGA